jgi:hypothetical protein
MTENSEIQQFHDVDFAARRGRRRDMSKWIQPVWNSNKLRAPVRKRKETSKWITSPEMSVSGGLGEIARRLELGLSVDPVLELTEVGQTHIPDIAADENCGRSEEIKTGLLTHRIQSNLNGAGHVWVGIGAQADILIVYSMFRCQSWPNMQVECFQEGAPEKLMDACAAGCGHHHYIWYRGWLPMSKVRKFKIVKGKGLEGRSYEVPFSALWFTDLSNSLTVAKTA